MYKIDLNFEITTVDGKPVGKAGKILAEQLGLHKSNSDVIKYYDWALSLHKEGKIQVDKEDLKKIKEFITNHESLYLFSKAQLLKYLDTLKDEKNK